MAKKKHRIRARIKHIYTRVVFRGFTLVELVVVIAIMLILLGTLILTVDPSTQINKALDVQRQRDLQEIKKGLDTYYSDYNCYPQSSSDFTIALGSGGEWSEGNMVYIKKTPADPNKTSYIYVTDTSALGQNCPQWNVMFAKLSKASKIATACPLFSIPTCVPQNIDETWACVISGSPDCSQVSEPLPLPTPLPTNTPAPTSTPVPTPTITPTPTPCTPKNWVCSGTPLRCNVVAPGTGTYCTTNCDGACL